MAENLDALAEEIVQRHPLVLRAAFKREEDNTLVAYFHGGNGVRQIETLQRLVVLKPVRLLGTGKTADGQAHVAVFAMTDANRKPTYGEVGSLNDDVWAAWRLSKGIALDARPDAEESEQRRAWMTVQACESQRPKRRPPT
jgi:hypothetical protein